MTPEKMQKRAEYHTALSERHSAISQHASDRAPGSYITGGSGRTRAQNRATDRGLDKTIKHAGLAIYHLRKAEEFRRMAAYNQPEAIEKRDAARLSEKESERRSKAQAASLTLVNDPNASLHITTSDWNKTHKDYKDILSNGKFRYRSVLRNSCLQSVFLTDKPVKELKERED